MKSETRKEGFMSSFARGVFSSRLGLLGAGVTTISAVLIIVTLAMALMGIEFGAYQGLVTYLLLPAFFVGGLACIPLGSWLSWRAARKRGGDDAAPHPFVIDLSLPAHRRFWGSVAVLSVINLVLLLSVSYQGYHYTESTEFCGKLCHSVMEPEYAAYLRSPHARVDCVECHIGSGASWFVKSKLSGLRQVWGMLANDFSRPIPTPIDNLRPARDTCEQCHWPELFHGNRLKAFEKAADDDKPTDSKVTALLLHVGGRDNRSGEYHGIHWHVSRDNLLEYRAVDRARQQIREIRVTGTIGKSETFVREDLPPLPAGAEWRSLDCIDCHNRPTHIFETPEEAVDRLILKGILPAALPSIRSAGLAAIKAGYPDRESAQKGIHAALLAYYKENNPDFAAASASAIEKAADVLFSQAYALNVYELLNIDWNTYVSQLGHRNENGCFRCHDDEHKSKDGGSIGQDCESCHSILTEDERRSEMNADLKSYLFLETETEE